MSISLFVLSSCEKELYDDAIIEKEKTSRVTINDLPFLKKIIDNKKTNRTSEDNLVFYLNKINTENIIQIIDQQGKKNFTFALNYEEQDTLYNLCVKETIKDEYSFKLVKYTSSNLNQWIEDIKNAVNSQINPNIIAEDLENKSTVYCVRILFTCPSGMHDLSNQMGCIYDAITWVSSTEITPCTGDGGGGESNTGNNSNSWPSNGNNGGGGIGPTNPNTVLTAPNVVVVTTPSVNYISNLGLNPLENAFLNNNDVIENQIQNYLNPNHSFSDYIFINQVIDQIMLNPTLYTSITPFLIEKRIDDSQLDPCSKGVFQQIKNTTNCDFANVLAKLNANGSIYNTTMKTEHNLDNDGNIIGDPANTKRTIQNVKYDYTIFVNPDFEDKTKLYIATFLLHEVVHAYFFALLDDLNSGITNSFYELPLLYNAFDSHSSNFNATLTHEEIANSYVNAIASALQEFQPGLPQQVYDDMAWSGLEDTSIFNTMHPPGSVSRQRILNRKAAEQSGHPIEQGTPQEQINYGQPCN